MRKGTATNVPGLYRNGATWVIRARAKDRAGVTIEKTKKLDGDLSKREAILALDELAAAVQAQARPGTELQAINGECVGDWLHSLQVKREGKIKGASIDTRLSFAETFILPWLDENALDIRKLKPSELAEWKLWLARLRMPDRLPARAGKFRHNPHAGKPYAKETLKSAWSTMRSLVAFVSVRDDLGSPMRDLRYDIEGRAKTKKAAATRDEVERLIAATLFETFDDRMMIVLGFVSGMRFCELSALERRDLFLDEGRLRIERSQVKGEVGSPKTEETRRNVTLPPEVVALLRAYLAWQDEAKPLGLERGLLFPGRRSGGYRYPNSLEEPLARCCKRAGVDKRMTSHCMRGTTNNLVRQAAGEIAARQMVGHADPEMTNTYSRVDHEERLGALRGAFGEAFGGAAKAGTA